MFVEKNVCYIFSQFAVWVFHSNEQLVPMRSTQILNRRLFRWPWESKSKGKSVNGTQNGCPSNCTAISVLLLMTVGVRISVCVSECVCWAIVLVCARVNAKHFLLASVMCVLAAFSIFPFPLDKNGSFVFCFLLRKHFHGFSFPYFSLFLSFFLMFCCRFLRNFPTPFSSVFLSPQTLFMFEF